MMKSVLVIGLGHFGKHIVRALNDNGYQIMAVDIDEERVNSIMSYVTSAQIGSSTNENFLESLGVGNFDACIVTIGNNFQDSLETTSILKELGAKIVISRAATDIQEKFLLRNGADQVVYPEKQLAAWTANTCINNSIADYIELGDGYSIYEMSLPEEWIGRTVLDLNVRRKYGINILGIRENGVMNMNISAETVMNEGVSILVLGLEKEIKKCFKL